MNKQLSPAERKQLRKRVETSMQNDSSTKKQNERLSGRSSPNVRDLIKNGDAKSTNASGLRPSSASGAKPPAPWQRPKVTPASAVYNRNDSSPKYNKAAASRINSAQQRVASSSPGHSPKPSPANLKSRQRAVTSSDVTKKSSTQAHPTEPRSRSTSSPSTKGQEVTKNANKNKEKPTPKGAVVFHAGKASVALPEIKKTEATLETKKKTEPEEKMAEKLLAVPKRSRAHVMPVSKTAKPQKKGHDFQPHELTEWVNWCDACGSIILSLFGKCLACKKCRMVCHAKCAQTVALTCEADEVRAMTQIDPSWYKTIVEETKDESTLKEYNTIHRVMPVKEIKARIEDFNKTVKSSQQMTLQEDGETFRGFIRVTMNLSRPVSVAEEKDSKKLHRSSSFYVNKGAVKALYLSSNTTAEEVVAALLKKYGIRDHPHKFALFEKQVREEGHIILRKMMTRERPLFLRLLWGDGNSHQHAFILQENETREIQWESFSLPELLTFLKILEKEQNDHITCIKTKFTSRRQDIVNAMNYRKKMGAK